MNFKCAIPASFSYCMSEENVGINCADLSYEIYDHIDTLPQEVVATLRLDGTDFFSIKYWKAFEKTYSGSMICKYVILHQQQKIAALIPIQFIHFKGNQFFKTYESKSLQRSYFKVFNKIVSPLSAKVLVAGNVFSGASFFKKSEQVNFDDDLLASMMHVLEQIQKSYGAKAILIKDIKNEFVAETPLPLHKKFFPIEVQPLMGLNQLSKWKNFEDYVASLSAKYRTRWKKAKQKGSDLSFQVLDKEKIATHQHTIQHFIENAIRNNGFVLAQPAAHFFYEMAQQVPDNFEVWGIFLNEKLVGFYTSFLSDNGVCSINFAGTDAAANQAHDVYLNLLFHVIERSIERQAHQIDLGRTAIEIKSAVGATPKHSQVYVKLDFPLGNLILEKSIRYFAKNPDWQIRNPFKQI